MIEQIYCLVGKINPNLEINKCVNEFHVFLYPLKIE